MANLVILSGYLGKKPELKTFENGDCIAVCSIADTETWKDKNGEKKEKTNWFNLVFRNKSAENFVKYFDKGAGVEIHGKLSNRKYESEGQTKYVTEIIVSHWEFPKGKGKSENSSGDAYESAGFGEPKKRNLEAELNDAIPDFDDESEIPF